jgi:hypothetical protein
MTNYNFHQPSQFALFAYPNAVAHGYTYDLRGCPANLAVNGPSGVLATYAQA